MLFKKQRDTSAPISVNEEPQAPTSSQDLAVTSASMKEANDLAPTKTTASQDVVYPSGLRLAFLLISVFASMFLVALVYMFNSSDRNGLITRQDRLIITTAIPKISDEFKAVNDIGWYGSAYFLTTCAFQLLFGKLYTYFSIKIVFLSSVLLFEVGSAVCGAAPTSVAFIVGRALAGVGGSGIMTGGVSEMLSMLLKMAS